LESNIQLFAEMNLLIAIIMYPCSVHPDLNLESVFLLECHKMQGFHLFWRRAQTLDTCASCMGITKGIDVNSFELYTKYTGPPIDCRNNTFSGSILCYVWIDRLYTIISQKSEYNTWHRWYFEILTSYPDSIKSGLWESHLCGEN